MAARVPRTTLRVRRPVVGAPTAQPIWKNSRSWWCGEDGEFVTQALLAFFTKHRNPTMAPTRPMLNPRWPLEYQRCGHNVEFESSRVCACPCVCVCVCVCVCARVRVRACMRAWKKVLRTYVRPTPGLLTLSCGMFSPWSCRVVGTMLSCRMLLCGVKLSAVGSPASYW